MRVRCKWSKGFYTSCCCHRPDSVKGKDGHFLRGRNSSIPDRSKINKNKTRLFLSNFFWSTKSVHFLPLLEVFHSRWWYVRGRRPLNLNFYRPFFSFRSISILSSIQITVTPCPTPPFPDSRVSFQFSPFSPSSESI